MTTTVTTPREVEFVHDDGGRAAAGFTSLPRSCAVDAIAIATERSYSEVRNEIAQFIGLGIMIQYPMVTLVDADPDLGVPPSASDRYLTLHGWTFQHSQGIKTASDLPREGRFLLYYVMGERGNMGHFSALVDGVLRDDTDTRHLPMYGWWSR